MKQTFFSIAFVALFAALLTSSCNKLGQICFDFAQNTTISTNAVTAAGPVTSTKSLGTGLNDQLTSKGINVSNVNSVTVNAITITIPSSAGYTFDDISAAEVLVNTTSLGKLPTTATGLSATFSAPSTVDLKSTFLSSTGATLTFNATFKKAVAASTINVQIPLNTCYQVL